MWLLKKQLNTVVSMQPQQQKDGQRISLTLWGHGVLVYKMIQKHQKIQLKV